MSSHTVHGDSHVEGLHDGCPRCAEHAERPFTGLDARMLGDLICRAVTRASGGGFGRSETEDIAVGQVLTALERTGKMFEVAPEAVAMYLLERWNIPVEFP